MGRRITAIELVEAREHGLGELAAWLTARRYRVLRPGLAGDALEDRPEQLIRLVELDADQPLADLRRVLERADRLRDGLPPPPTLAVVTAGGDQALARALALGFHDAVLCPLDEAGMERRLAHMSRLAGLHHALARRAAVDAEFAPAQPPETPGRRGGTGRHVLDVLLIGPARQHKVRLAELLANCRLQHAETLEAALANAHLAPPDLIVLDPLQAGGSPLPDRLARLPGRCPVIMLRAEGDNVLPLHDDSATGRTLRRQVVDELALPMPAPLMQLRINAWLELARCARQLGGSAAARDRLGKDHLTGLADHGYFMAMAERARQAGSGEQVIALRLADLDRINAAHGYATGNRCLAAIGESLAAGVRIEDLAARVRGGVFAAALLAPSGDQAAIAARLADDATQAIARLGLRGTVLFGHLPLVAVETARDVARAARWQPAAACAA